jgi:hypothetical protein
VWLSAVIIANSPALPLLLHSLHWQQAAALLLHHRAILACCEGTADRFALKSVHTAVLAGGPRWRRAGSLFTPD